MSFNFDDEKNNEVEKYIKSIEVNDITPREALDILYVLQDMLK